MLQATDQMTLQAYSDSDWASCPESRRSNTGYVLLFGNSQLLGNQKNKAQFLDLHHNLNIEQWL